MPKYMDESNAGGVAAKYGFYFQDVVATLYATQMLLDKQIIGVRCEVKDDIDILYKDRIEYVQVKTTDVGGKWTLKDLTSKKKSSSTKKHIPKSSILHKSMECDDDANLPSTFRLVTEQPVNNSLRYLTIPKANRNEKSGFEKLAKSINSGLGKNYLSPLGNNGDYWVKNTYWEVLFSPEHIFEKAERNILQAADALLGHSIKLKDATDIVVLITNNLLKKSQLSRVIHTADDKK